MSGRRPASVLSPSRFRFLGVDGELDQLGNWNNPAHLKLWLYNLHYFDDLDAIDAAQRAAWHQSLIDRWIRENPPGCGNGWEPYPLSLRIVNWIKWACRTDSHSASVRESLAAQVRWLGACIEYHLLGNHLWANAKALTFAGCYFKGMEADAWLTRGSALLQRELVEQVLRDGGHFERSPMYHAIVLEDLLDLIQLDRCYPGRLPGELVTRVTETIPRMLRWLALMSHPDGRIALVNDAAFDIAPDLQPLLAYARALGVASPVVVAEPLEVLAESGYVRVTLPGMVAILDVGAIGPDYLPGHAHADTLSFELSIAGERVIVDSGTSTYQPGPQRAAQRSTRAHNTVSVEGQDSSEVWGGFRVARRARVHGVRCTESPEAIVIEAWHDGYMRLPQKVLHKRTWRFEATRMFIDDALTGQAVRAAAHWHLSPMATTVTVGEQNACFTMPTAGRLELCFSSSAVQAHDDHWHPRFGESIPGQRIDVALLAGHLRTAILWREDSFLK